MKRFKRRKGDEYEGREEEGGARMWSGGGEESSAYHLDFHWKYLAPSRFNFSIVVKNE